jgi:succinylarginine dihydrolase
MREHQFDGLVGPTHHYAGLSPGNLASQQHAGERSDPRAAALEGLAKMCRVRDLGVAQAVLPPHPRPSLALLRRLGFGGGEQQVLERALRDAPELLHAASSASSMWAANAACVAPAPETRDHKTHIVPANLASLLHRSIESEATERVLRAIFSDRARFAVHAPLPAGEALADEGAANHTRLFTEQAAVHIFGWGRSASRPAPTARFRARQTEQASRALARICQLSESSTLLWQQDPRGIDAGAFHTDVLAVGNGSLLLLHERAFVEHEQLLARLSQELGAGFKALVATEKELPLVDAVAAYPFNSQLLTLPDGRMWLVSPRETQNNAAAQRFLARAVAESEAIADIDYLDVNGSMRNGGGPACLRLRVPLSDADSKALAGNVLLDTALEQGLRAIIERRYRDRLSLADMADPALLVEARTALDEITQLLGIGAVFDFQS